MAKADNSRKAVTPKFRVSFPWIFKPQPPMQGSAPGTEAKYGLTMLFDAEAQKSPEFQRMKALASAAAKEKWGDKLPANLRNPFRKGEEKSELEGYGEGVIFVNATTKMQPGLVDGRLQRITAESDFYAGCYARATVTAYAYDKAGNKGVSFGLQNVQKLADGESFSGRAKAEDEFEAVETDAWTDGDEGGTDEGFLS